MHCFVEDRNPFFVAKPVNPVRSEGIHAASLLFLKLRIGARPLFTSLSKIKRSTALIAGVALLITVIVTTNFVVLWRMHQQTLADAQAALLQHSLTLAETIEQTLRATDLVLGNLAERMRVAAAADNDSYQKTVADRDTYSLLKEKASELPQLDALAFIGTDGRLLNISRAWPAPDLNFADREDFPVAKSMPQSSLSFIMLQYSRLTKEWLLVLTRAAATGQGAFLGEVDAALKLKYFETLFSSTSLGDGYAVSLMRQDGVNRRSNLTPDRRPILTPLSGGLWR
jgi:hypothetical protein